MFLLQPNKVTNRNKLRKVGNQLLHVWRLHEGQVVVLFLSRVWHRDDEAETWRGIPTPEQTSQKKRKSKTGWCLLSSQEYMSHFQDEDKHLLNKWLRQINSECAFYRLAVNSVYWHGTICLDGRRPAQRRGRGCRTWQKKDRKSYNLGISLTFSQTWLLFSPFRATIAIFLFHKARGLRGRLVRYNPRGELSVESSKVRADSSVSCLSSPPLWPSHTPLSPLWLLSP